MTLTVKMIDAVGAPLARNRLESLYASLPGQPLRRYSQIRPDGTVDLEVPNLPVTLHARLDLPEFGDLWVTADGRGGGFLPSSSPVDFGTEALATALAELERYTGTEVSPAVRAQVRAAHFLARKGDVLGALAQALWAGEALVVEKARRRLAQNPPRLDFLFGCNAFQLLKGTHRATTFAEVFNFATLPFYLVALEPEEGQPRYDEIDRLLQTAEDHGLVAKGHPLWWGNTDCNPPWLRNADLARVRSTCERVVRQSVERYRGRIRYWDVINEAHDFANGFSLSPVENIELTRLCCDTVRQSDPEAVRIVNVCAPFAEYVADGTVAHGPVRDPIVSPLTYLKGLLAAGVEFEVIGIQLYFPVRDLVAIDRLLDEYAALGKPIHITEMGVSARRDGAPPDPAKLQLNYTNGRWRHEWSQKVQADWVEAFYTLAYSRPEIQALTWWDFVEPAFIHCGSVLDAHDQPREMYFRLQELRREWSRPFTPDPAPLARVFWC